MYLLKDYTFEAFSNPVINATVIAWFIAQSMKVLLVLLSEKRFDFSRFIGLGGMPSSHASTVCCLATAIAKTCGLNSPEFAICFIFATVTMTDAAGVRLAAGQQAKVLNKMMYSWDDKDPDFFGKKLKELIGHTPLQVFTGAAIGIAIGLLVKIN